MTAFVREDARMKGKLFTLLAIIIFLLSMTACDFAGISVRLIYPSQTPLASLTPYPTGTPYPTYTAQPTNTLQPTLQPTATFGESVYSPITWDKLALLLEKDLTNQKTWNADTGYKCVEFSTDLVNNLHDAGYDAWIVGIVWSNDALEGHAFVAVPTSDLGIVYIEPQDDARYISPEIGKPLCRISDPNDCEAIDGIIYDVGSIIDPAVCDVNTNTCSGIIR